MSLRCPFDACCLQWETLPHAQTPASASQKCASICNSGGPFRSGTPHLSQGLSQKLAITGSHESRPTSHKTQQTFFLDKGYPDQERRPHAELFSLQAPVTYTLPEHSFLKMTSMTMQLCAPPGRTTILQRHREVSMARTALPAAATRRKRVSGKQTRCLVGATFDDYGTGPSAVGLLTQAASLVAVTAAAWWAARLASQQVSAVVWNLLLRGSRFIILQFAEWLQICQSRCLPAVFLLTISRDRARTLKQL